MHNFTVLFRIILPGIIFYVIAMHCLAQRQPYTFPKIRQEDFKDRVYDKDTSAAAVILGDQGESFFEYNGVNRRNQSVSLYESSKANAFAVRCVKD